jgi:hypothetical protein
MNRLGAQQGERWPKGSQNSFAWTHRFSFGMHAFWSNYACNSVSSTRAGKGKLEQRYVLTIRSSRRHHPLDNAGRLEGAQREGPRRAFRRTLSKAGGEIRDAQSSGDEGRK